MRSILLTNGGEALVDDQDFDWLNQWCWHRSKSGYARHSLKKPDPVYGFAIYMHKLILGLGSGEMGDHRDRNPLNNQRYNLRPATNAKNQWNTGTRVHNTSGRKGISWDRNRGKWIAHFMHNGQMKHVGRFTSLEEATSRYDQMVIALKGDFAITNAALGLI